MNVIEILRSFASELVSGLLGLITGYVISGCLKQYRRWRRRRVVTAFFGLSGPITVVHSAVFDKARGAYDLPACDTAAARYVACVFQRAGLDEDKDYKVRSDVDLLLPDGTFPQTILEQNLVLICSPKRNRLTEKILRSAHLRYQMRLRDDMLEIQIHDSERSTDPLTASRDRLGQTGTSHTLSGHDFALVASFPNPFNPIHTAVVLAGIHGTGTLGAARFVAQADNLRELLRRQHHGRIQEILRVQYSGTYETVTDIRLV